MQYSHTKEKANEYASEALDRIHKEGLSKVPQNFELWYCYYAEADIEVVRAIDILIANKQKITDDTCAYCLYVWGIPVEAKWQKTTR